MARIILNMRENEISEPFPSDFEGQRKLPENKDGHIEFDFSEAPQSPLSVSRYLHYKGQTWRGPEAAIEFLRKEYKRFVGKKDKTKKDEREMEWVVKMGKILKNENKKPIPPATIDQADRWLGKMIKDKSMAVLDAQRQGDTEMANSYQIQERQLDELLNYINDKNWGAINIDDANAPLNSCIADTRNTYEFQKKHGRKKQADEAGKKLDALLQIRSLIERHK